MKGRRNSSKPAQLDPRRVRVGGLLRHAREAAGYSTVEALARDAQVSAGMVAGLERGTAGLDGPTLARTIRADDRARASPLVAALLQAAEPLLAGRYAAAMRRAAARFDTAVGDSPGRAVDTPVVRSMVRDELTQQAKGGQP